MVIAVSVCGVGLGFWGLVLVPLYMRVHPISQRRIVTGMSISMTALLCMRTFFVRFKIVPGYGLVERRDKRF